MKHLKNLLSQPSAGKASAAVVGQPSAHRRYSRLKHLALMLCFLLGSLNVWGETSTLTFTAKANGSGTADDNVAWTVTSDGTESQFDNSKGIHYGTSSAKVQYIRLSTSEITGTITQVVVNASAASGVSATVGVTVGGSAFGGDPKSISTTATNYTFTGSASGEIVVTVTKPSSATKAIYCKSVAVTYTSGGGDQTGDSDVPVTGVTLDGSSITLTVDETRTLEATVTPDDATNKNVAWESSDEAVATVSNAGLVTAVGAGDATITCKSVADDTKFATCAVHVNASPYTKSTLIFTAACGGSGIADDDAVWTVTSDGEESNYDGTSGIHYGTNSKNVTYLQLETSGIEGTVAKVVVNARDAQATATISVTVGEEAFSCTNATATNTSSDYTFTGSGSGKIVVRVDRGSSMAKAIYVKSIIVTYEPAAPAAVATPTISGDDNFLTNTTVTLACETTGAAIYYTIDGTEPSSSSTLYSNPFTLDATATVKAIAISGTDESAIAEKEFTKLTAYTTIPAMFTAATSTETEVYVTFNNWVVSGVSTNGKNVYVTDGTNGFIIFDNNGGLDQHFAVGNTLSGTSKCKLVLYNGAAELKELNSETAGLTITTGGTISENTTPLAELTGLHIGSLISISGSCSVDNNRYYVNNVQLYNSLFAFEALTAGSNYNVSGIYVYHSTYGNEICPRSAADIVEQQDKNNAETQWVAASKTVRMGDATTGWWSTASDGEKTFASSNTEVATIDASTGEITLVAPGKTNLTFSTAETENFYAGPTVTLALTVKAALPAGGTEFTWVAANMGVENATPVTTATGNEDPISIVFGGTGTASTYYTSGESVRMYVGNTVTISSNTEGKLLYGVEITWGGTKQVLEGEGLENGTWSGLAHEVVFTVPSGSGNQAHIQALTVIYADGTVTTLSIANVAMKTTDEPLQIVPTCNVTPTPAISYEIATADQAYATIENGVITPNAVGGPINVTARIAQGSNYTAAVAYFTITVADKTIPALSFDEASYEATMGSEFTAPVLNNEENVTVAYSSSDETVAQVNETSGEITLVAAGETTITANFEGNDDFAANSASYTLTVNPAPVVLTDYYEKVTTTAGITEGTYLIVYEEGSVAFNGGLETLDAASNTISVDITNDNKIGVTSETTAATFYIDPVAGTIKATNGKYIGKTADSNGLDAKDDVMTNTFSIDEDGNAVITGSGNAVMRYNATSEQYRFRYFKSSSYTNQKAIQLYKLANEVIKADAGLAWNPAEDITLTVGEAFSAPALLNPNGIDAAEITIASSNELVATVSEGVVSLVENATGTTTITATYTGETYKPITVSYKIKVNPAHSIYVSPGLNVNFNSVQKDATVEDQVITVTLTEVDAATLTLAGDGASAFSISTEALTTSGDVTISASSATAGTFAATLTISDDANQAESKVVNLSLTVTEVEDKETSKTWDLTVASYDANPTEEQVTWSATYVSMVADKANSSTAANNYLGGDANKRTSSRFYKNSTLTITPNGKEITSVVFTATSENYATVLQSSTWTNATASVSGSTVTVTPTDGTIAISAVLGNTCGFSAVQVNYTTPTPTTYTVTYDLNGGTGTTPTQEAVEANTEITLHDGETGITAPEGKEFDKWNDGTTDYAPGETYTVGTSNVVLTAQWKDATPAPSYETIRTGLISGEFYTICMPKNIVAAEGAIFWSIIGADEEGADEEKAYLESVEGTLEAGMPYFFQATAEVLKVVYGEDEVIAPKTASDHSVANGLVGTFEELSKDHLMNMYILTGANALQQVVATSGNVTLPAYRAYVNRDAISGGAPTSQPVSGRRRVAMAMPRPEQTPTTLEAINAAELQNGQKLVINGHLYIVRDGRMFDATGRLVK